jgi:hypothetical protein
MPHRQIGFGRAIRQGISKKTAWIVAEYEVFLPTSKSGARVGFTNLDRHARFANGRHPLPSSRFQVM